LTGNDSYIVNIANNLTIEETDGGIDTLQISSGFDRLDSLIFSRENRDLLIRNPVTNNSLRIKNQWESSDGSKIEYLDLNSNTLPRINLLSSIFGTNQSETIEGNNDSNFILGQGGNDRIYGGFGNDTVIGSSGNDTLVGGEGEDHLLGQGGADLLVAQSGNNFLEGGLGADEYQIGDLSVTTTITEIGLSDTDDIDLRTWNLSDVSFENVSDDLILRKNTQSVTIKNQYSNTGKIEIIHLANQRDIDTSRFFFGQNGNDQVTGSDSDDLILGQAGNDTLSGLGGNDTLMGGSGADHYVITENENVEIQEIGSDIDRIVVDFLTIDDVTFTKDPNSQDLVIVSRLNGQTIRIKDQFSSESGNPNSTQLETIEFKFSEILNLKNLVLGTDQNDVIDLRNQAPSDDNIVAGEGDDWVMGGGGNDAIYGGAGYDHLFGDAGNDSLFGSSENDYIEGGTGNDELSDGIGSDTLVGGDGADRFVITPDDRSVDIIQDFELDKDIIDLSGFANRFVTLEHFFLQGGKIENDLDGTIMFLGNEQLVKIKGIQADSLNYRHFEFIPRNENNSAHAQHITQGLFQISDNDGNDVITMGPFSTLVLIPDATHTNTVTDFDTLTDKLDLSAFSGLYDRSQLQMTQYGASTILALPNAQKIILQNINKARLDDSDFIFKQNPKWEKMDWLTSYNETDPNAALYPFSRRNNYRLDTFNETNILASQGPTPSEIQIIANTRGGNDRLTGGSGNDRLFGGLGADTISGGLGNDLISGGDGDDLIYGNTLTGPTATIYQDTIFGDAGNDVVYGDENDLIYGGSGDD